jgi:hypothetical protein
VTRSDRVAVRNLVLYPMGRGLMVIRWNGMDWIDLAQDRDQ